VGFASMANIHQILVNVLLEEFEGLILKPEKGVQGMGPTLNDIWAGKKRLIICYNDKRTVNGKKILSCV